MASASDDKSLVERLAAMESRMAWLEEQNRLKDAVIIEQLERIKELEAALEESRRGGKRQAAPFSKGTPTAAKRPGRKSGGDHGRHGHRRAPEPTPDRVLDAMLPSACPDCGGQLRVDRVDALWQVDIPPVRPAVTRFNVTVGHCGDCGRRVQGHHPEQTSAALGSAASTIGPVAKAWGAWLHYGLGLSFSKCTQVLARLGIEVTAGAICQAAQTQASRELAPVHTDLVAAANRSATLTMDETGWRVGGWGAWLWVAANDDLSVYWVTPGRSFDDATATIRADFDGIIVRDGWAVYDRYGEVRVSNRGG